MSHSAAGTNVSLPDCMAIFADDDPAAVPIQLVAGRDGVAALSGLDDAQRRWVAANGFKGEPRECLLVPGRDGAVAVVLFGVGTGETGRPCGSGAWLAGDLPAKLPPGTYAFAAGACVEAMQAWGLGSYRFRQFKSKSDTDEAPDRPRLVLVGSEVATVRAATDAVWLGRDLINRPANDLGPEELEATARALADQAGGTCEGICGDDLLAGNFPMIHAVGRASARAPRLIDLRWGRPDAPRVTLVGKGIVFDTGGLDLKPAAAMLLMKKDMGGAASALAAAHMIMTLGLNVQLRVLIAAAENSVAGNAFRPGDVLTSRTGQSVEIGNTDAEGRLVLADALALASEEAPELILSFATLTGAARVALGPDLPAMFATDDAIAQALANSGMAVADPVWRLPFWPDYDRKLKSPVADMNNISIGPFAGAVTAALFLKRFVSDCGAYVHFDMYGWRPETEPLGPKGGEPHVARAVVNYLMTRYGAAVS